jgi:hypothetical protein
MQNIDIQCFAFFLFSHFFLPLQKNKDEKNWFDVRYT